MTSRIYGRLSQPIGTDLPDPQVMADYHGHWFASVPLDSDGLTTVHVGTAAEARRLSVHFAAAGILLDQHERARAAIEAALAPVAGKDGAL